MDQKTDLLQGTLDLLILKAVTLGPNHGLGISRRIAQMTRDTFDVKPGSLFPALHRLEERGWLQGRWVEKAGQRRRRFYRLTAEGRRVLASQRNTWKTFVSAMRLITGVDNA